MWSKKGAPHLKSFSELAESVKFKVKGTRVEVVHKDAALEFIGAGRSAFIFKIQSTDKVIKVFFPPYTSIAKEEAKIYETLQGNTYYPAMYEAGSNYLVIDFIAGDTLYECLSKGIPITKESITEIDAALKVARLKGLNPSDIHLRNIFITNEGNIKIIDVARFKQTKDCTQWSDLKKAFYKFYCTPFFPKKIPVFILNIIAALYKKKLLPI
jgi:predicted Ser/Thr protein kinase